MMTLNVVQTLSTQDVYFDCSNVNCLHGSVVSSVEYPFEEECTQDQIIKELKRMYEVLITEWKELKKIAKSLDNENSSTQL